MQFSPIETMILKVRPAVLAIFLKNIFGISRRKTDTVLGFSFFVDPVSLFGAQLVEKGIYEPRLTAAIQVLLRPGDVFFDVGANEGYFSILGSAAVKKEGKVFLVEPQTRLQPIIRKNLSLNDCKNVEVIPAVFSDKSGVENLNLSMSVNSGSSSLHRRSFFMKKESVRSVTFDEFIIRNPVKKIRLIKIDCEGAEFSILSGARNLLKEHIAEIISVDYHPHIVGATVVRKMDGLLRSSGYLLTETARGPWFYYLPASKDDLIALGPLKDIPPL